MHFRGLYAITPDWPDSTRVLLAVEAALEGGAAAVQFRRKQLTGKPLHAEAHEMAELCRRKAVPFIINDNAQLARECAADGVHLGRHDEDVTSAREMLGRGKLVGVSCYGALERVLAAESAGADYAAIGCLFPSRTKPDATLTPLTTLTKAKAASGIPLVGIGGITPANADTVKLAGADMVAVIGALFESASVRDTARLFSALWE